MGLYWSGVRILSSAPMLREAAGEASRLSLYRRWVRFPYGAQDRRRGLESRRARNGARSSMENSYLGGTVPDIPPLGADILCRVQVLVSKTSGHMLAREFDSLLLRFLERPSCNGARCLPAKQVSPHGLWRFNSSPFRHWRVHPALVPGARLESECS